METLTKTDTDLFIQADTLNDLLTGAALFTDKNIAACMSVALTIKDNKLIAAATNRYALIVGSAAIPDTPDMELRLITGADIKTLSTTLKTAKKATIRVKITAQSLTLNSLGSDLTINLFEGKFPEYKHLFPTEFNAVERMSFNPNLMATFGKLTDKTGGINVRFNGEHKAMEITFTGASESDPITWRGLLMPMKTNH